VQGRRLSQITQGANTYSYTYNASGTKLISYHYNAWGLVYPVYSNGGRTTSAVNNPFKYRGYYHDSETGFYYLNSRYYDPEICRFLNPDAFVSTGQGLIGYNMFVYCGNNPVMRIDTLGNKWWKYLIAAVIAPVVPSVSTAMVVNEAVNDTNENKIEDQIADTYSKRQAEIEINALLEKYCTDNVTVKITFNKSGATIENSYLVESRFDRQRISMILSRVVENGNYVFARDYENISAEWIGHNVINYVDSDKGTESADLDYVQDGRRYVRVISSILAIVGVI